MKKRLYRKLILWLHSVLDNEVDRLALDDIIEELKWMERRCPFLRYTAYRIWDHEGSYIYPLVYEFIESEKDYADFYNARLEQFEEQDYSGTYWTKSEYSHGEENEIIRRR